MQEISAGCFGSTNRLVLKSFATFSLVLISHVGQMGAAPVTGRTQHLTNSTDVPEGLATSEWSSIRAAYTANRHAAFPVAGGHHARNPGQQWRTEFDGRGFTTQPDAGGWHWGLELRSYGFSGQEQTVSGQPVVTTEGQRVTYAWDARLQEWFVNDARGLEHGFTVNKRPGGATIDGDARLQFTFAVRGGLRPEVSAEGTAMKFVDTQEASVVTYGGLKVWDADGKILPAQFLNGERGLTLAVDERGARYPLTIDPIAQQAYLKASNTGQDDRFGKSVAVSGDTVVIGAPLEASRATGVNGDESDNSLMHCGAAYVFVRNGATWSQQAYLKPSTSNEFQSFGWSVAASGDTVVVGAIGSGDSGAAYVFVRTGTTWNQQALLTGSNSQYFGHSVGCSGDSIVVGAPLGVGEDLDLAGAAYVFVRSATTWTQQARFTEPGYFGSSVAISGDTIAIGKNIIPTFFGIPDPDSGTVYVFERNGTTWTQQALLETTSDTDEFAESLSISGDTLVVGAAKTPGLEFDDINNGAAHVFARNGSAWNQQALLKASNSGTQDEFGISVAVSGNTIVVGAWGEDINAGAAYVFARSGTAWNEQAYVKASNPGGGDLFGGAVAISGNTLVVGARGEPSNATGVNGNQNDNSAPSSGAAYMFNIENNPPTIAITTPIASGSYTTMPTATGTASDDSAVQEVRVALARSSDGFWWNFASNTWGNAVFAFDYTVKIAAGTTNWSASLPSLPVGGYQLHVQSVDIADLGSPWIFRNFTIETGTTVTVATDPTNWRESTTVDSTSADEVPWPGVTSLPEASTFTEIPTEGTTHINAVPGAATFASGSSVRFFRSTFTLPHFDTLALDVRASFDNDLQIFINGHELALEGNYALANFSGPNHRIVVNQDGSINNDYEGEQVFSTRVATNFPSSFFQTGSNEIVLALRNNNGGDGGGVAFRADFLMTGVEDTDSPTVAITTPTTNGSYSTMPMATGTASASGGVREVLVALNRNSDGFWWNFTNSAWGNSVWDYRTVIATGTTNWSANLPPLPTGGYQVHAQTMDMADQGSAWLTRHFTIAASGETLVVCSPPVPGLVSWWAGEGDVADIQGVNPGVLVGPATFPQGKVGSAFHFGGQNFVQVADAPTLRPAHVTIEAWVKFDSLESPNTASPGLQYILFKKNTRTLNFEGYSLLKHRVGGVDKFAFQVTSASGAIAHVDSLGPVSVNQWYHLAGSYDGAVSKLYVNGAEQGTQAGNFPLDYGDRPLFIGSSGEGNHDGRFVGDIDEASIYSRALSTSEIQSIFQAGALGKCKPSSVEQTYSTNVTVNFPPLPPGADAILTAAPSSPGGQPVEVTVVLTNDVHARNVEINAAVGSLLRLLVPDFISLNAVSVIVGAGGELSVNGQVVANVTVRDDGVIFLGRGIVGDVYNLQGMVARSRPDLQRAIIKEIVGSGIGRLTPDRILEAGLTILRMLRVQFFGPLAAQGSDMDPPTPSSSVTPMSINGDYDQTVNGTLFIAIGGTSFVTDGAQEYDRMEVTGTASLSGVIGFDLVDLNSPMNNANPFQPQAGAQFDIVVASNIVIGDLVIRGPVWGDGLGMTWGVVTLLDGREALRLVAVHIPPPMAIQRQASAVKIFYPTNFTGYTLQKSPTVTSTNWTAISIATNRIEIATTNTSDYFRLFKQ